MLQLKKESQQSTHIDLIGIYGVFEEVLDVLMT
jgi:hypothetical protein